MKKRIKWPRPTQRVTRTTQILGPITAFRNAAAVQKNTDALKALGKKMQWLPNVPKQNIVLALASIARQMGLVLSA